MKASTISHFRSVCSSVGVVLAAIVLAASTARAQAPAAPAAGATKQTQPAAPPAKPTPATTPAAAPAKQAPAKATPAAGLANPASKNCTDKGGKLSMEQNGKGGTFGVCTFSDNQQCEEWALMRGDCPVGGLKVTGYNTPAARYCAISGGSYKARAARESWKDRGQCELKDGRTCLAVAYYNGGCEGGSASAERTKTIHAVFKCDGNKSIDVDFVNSPSGNKAKLKLSDGREYTLLRAPSASGARYATGLQGVVFWNKGDTATLEENGKMTFNGCVTTK